MYIEMYTNVLLIWPLVCSNSDSVDSSCSTFVGCAVEAPLHSSVITHSMVEVTMHLVVIRRQLSAMTAIGDATTKSDRLRQEHDKISH
jgi:hypothetical protein